MTDWADDPYGGYFRELETPSAPPVTIHATESSGFTCLYDANGERLYRRPQRIGFALD